MKIQEALSKVKELKTDAFALLGEAQNKKQKTIYLELKDQYTKPKSEGASVSSGGFEVDNLIEEALSKLAYAHDLKLAVQKANTLVGITELIQEKDFLKMICNWLEPLLKVEAESDPMLESNYSISEAIYIKRVATFNTEDVKDLHEKAVERIREIEIELQRKNWEVDIEEVYKEEFMRLLDKLTP